MKSDFADRIAALEAQLAELKAEAAAAQSLPDEFVRCAALSFLCKPSYDTLDQAFIWSDTPQGHAYWQLIAYNCGDQAVPDAAKLQIQEWVIRSYRNQYGH